MATFLILSLLLHCGKNSTAEGWRGIVPLHSTRTDVEKLLGPATEVCQCVYYLDDVNVMVFYSTGNCKAGGVWDVQKDIVTRIIVHPKPNPRLSDLKIDESKFEKKPEGIMEGLIIYTDKENGLVLDVYYGSVQAITYVPTAKEQHLRCL